MDSGHIGNRHVQRLVHYRIGVAVAAHRGQDRRLGSQGRKIFAAWNRSAERFVDCLIRPDQRLFQVNFMVGAELRGLLPNCDN